MFVFVGGGRERESERKRERERERERERQTERNNSRLGSSFFAVGRRFIDQVNAMSLVA